MGLLKLFGLVVSPNQKQNPKDKTQTNVTLTQRIQSYKIKSKIGKDNNIPTKMKSILKPPIKKEKYNTDKVIENMSVTVQQKINVKKESEDDMKEDPLCIDDVEIDLEIPDTGYNDKVSISEIEIKEDDREAQSDISLIHSGEAKVISNQKNLERHIAQKHSGRVKSKNPDDEYKLKCQMCDKRFSKVSNLKSHISKKHPTYFGDEVDEETKRKWNQLGFDQERIKTDPIWNHVRNIDCSHFNYSKGSVECNYCKKNINFSKADHHVWSMHKILVERPSRFKKSTRQKSSWIWNHLSVDSENKFRCICQLCNKNLSKTGIEKHLRQVHNLGDQILCSVCGKSFRDTNTRNTHELTHTESYKYHCSECGKGFYEKYKMTEHILRTHNEGGEKPFLCSDCGKTFKTSYSCLLHTYQCRLKSHTNPIEVPTYTEEMMAKKPHKCDICGKRFAKESYFNLHMKIHSGETKIECEECGKSFTEYCSLKAHVNTVHSDVRPYSCSVCSKTFKYPKLIRSHKCVPY